MSWGRNFISMLRRGRGGALATSLLCIGALLPSASTAAMIMEYESVLQISTTEDRAIRPVAVTCDGLTGDICVTDAQYARFHVLNKHGVEVFGTGDYSELSNPADGSLTPRGDFAFIDRYEDRVLTIRQLNFMGEPIEFNAEIPIENWEPVHLVVTRDGNFLTLDSYHNILTKHNSRTGALVWLTNVTGDDATELQLGRPAEAPDGRIYVPSGILHSVLVYSEGGNRVGDFGEFGTGPGKLVYPVGVAIGPGESILVLDRMRSKVLMFDTDHNLLGDFGSMGAGMGQFYHPSAIAASEDGTVYVAQGYGSRVQVFNIHDSALE